MHTWSNTQVLRLFREAFVRVSQTSGQLDTACATTGGHSGNNQADFIAPHKSTMPSLVHFTTHTEALLGCRGAPLMDKLSSFSCFFSYLVESAEPLLRDTTLQSPKTNSFIWENLVCCHLRLDPFFIFPFFCLIHFCSYQSPFCCSFVWAFTCISFVFTDACESSVFILSGKVKMKL